jgi:hypothetical protein
MLVKNLILKVGLALGRKNSVSVKFRVEGFPVKII